MILNFCPYCGTKMGGRTSEKLAKVTCAKCGAVFLVEETADGHLAKLVLSTGKKKKDGGKRPAEPPLKPRTWERVTLGTYPQNKTNDNKKPIEWLVLKRDGTKALLLAAHALDCQQYNNAYVNAPWQESAIRGWLNGMFLLTAFTTEERTRMLKRSHMGIGTVGSTVFLLSTAEAEQLLPTDEERQCEATGYAKGRGASANTSGTCWWWLRSPGSSSRYPASVNRDGSISKKGDRSGTERGCVRPCIWVDTDGMEQEETQPE